MLFTSLVFVGLFLPIVILVYYVALKRSRTAQNVFLMLASLFFYAWGEPWFVFVMIGVILYDYALALLMTRTADARRRKALLVCAVAGDLLILGVFKYLGFVSANINALAERFGESVPVMQLALPIGISFFTFQALSYVIDVYRGAAQVQKNPLNVALYISFFPQLIAGPIVRYQTIADQILGRRETVLGFTEGVRRFLAGFAKKIFIANNAALVADRAFELTGADGNSVGFAWIGALAYTIQIFFDFSGYSDMAIGLGRMFGFRFLENFNYPYIARSTSEFWRRWHMSLGQWFRDYVYFPLGGSRVGTRRRLLRNLFVVWLLTGVWHGANWTFVLWGLLYCATISFEKLTGIEKAAWAQTRAGCVLRHVGTMLLVVFGWVLFRAGSVGEAAAYMGNMVGAGGLPAGNDLLVGALRESWVFLALGALFSTPVAPRLTAWIEARLDRRGGDTRLGAAGASYTAVTALAYAGAFAVCLSYLVKGSYNPFIYFNF